MITQSTGMLLGIDSTVQKKYFASLGKIFSSPVMRAILLRPNLCITGEEKFSILGLSEIKPGSIIFCEINSEENKKIELRCRIDTNKELEYYKAGGILNYVLNEIISEAA